VNEHVAGGPQADEWEIDERPEPARPVCLVCTVGGSPQPIATALRVLRPDAVWFLVSDGRSAESSQAQVDSAEIEYDRATGTRGPGLRFADGCPADCRVTAVPADNPDAAYKECRSALREARRRYPGHRLITDYTGGTKSMTGALLMAAFAQPGVEVQFMAGERRDLVHVQAGSEKPQIMAADFVLAERDFAAAEQAVAGYDYAAARELLAALETRLDGVGTRPPKAWRRRLSRAFDWTSTMALWDAFDHREAAKRVRREPALRDMLATTGHLQPLQALDMAAKGKPGWDVCADLWLNALRRGERGRYDDAVARLYRLVEAAVQAQLWSRHGLESGRIAPDLLPPELGRPTTKTDSKTGVQYALLGLDQTVKLLRLRDPADPLAAVYARDDGTHGPPWLVRRNNSILAHGFTSIGAEAWTEARDWVETHLTRFFVGAIFAQLPRWIPDLDVTPDPASEQTAGPQDAAV
jgi:CRISPR-associated protein (TIGR02710 family)